MAAPLDLQYFQAAGQMYNQAAQNQNNRLQMLAEQDARAMQEQRMMEQLELEKREKERQRYAEWEKQQIMNSATSRLQDMAKAKEDSGEKLSLNDMMIGQNKLAAEEAQRRGRGDLATGFMAEADKISSMKTKMLQEEEKRKLDQEGKMLENEEKRRKLEAARDGKAELSTVKDADKIFGDRTNPYKQKLDDIQYLLVTAEKAALGSPQASQQLDTQLAKLFDSGTLSTKDVDRIKNAGSFVGRIENSISNWIQGTASEASLKDKAEFVRAMEKVLAEDYNSSIDGAVKTMGKTNIDKELLQDYSKRKYVIPGSGSKEEKPQTMSNVRILPDGRKIRKNADGSLEVIQ